MTHRFTLLSADAVRDALDSARRPVLVDIRSAAAFEAGHIPGSRHAPVHDLGERRAALPANLAERLIVIGDDRERAYAAANFLALVGFGDVAVLEGGIATWDGGIVTGPPEPPPRSGAGPELRVIPSED